MSDSESEGRRPLDSRNTGWAKRITEALTRTSLTPNQISIFSIGFAAVAGLLFFFSGRVDDMPRMLFLLFAGIAVQMRLLCNLFDGLLAVEAGRQTKDGGVYNELPDRIADILILVGVGYGVGIPELGWAAASFAIFTAYVRELGHGLGTGVDFSGPQAKPHRMAVVTIGAWFAIIETLVTEQSMVMKVVLWIVVIGSAITVVRRSMRLLKTLNA